MFPQKTSAAASAFGYDSSREKAILENPQIFQNCEIINNISADDAQSEAERIPNRPAAPLLYNHCNSRRMVLHYL